MRRTPLLALAFLAGLASNTEAQGTYRDYLARQLHAISQTIAVSGYRLDAAAIIPGAGGPVVALESTSSVGLEVVLQSGQQYQIATGFYGWEGQDCAKSLEDRFGNTLFAGAWSKDRITNLLDFTAPASGTHILVFNCPDGASQFYYEVYRMWPEGSYRYETDAYPSDMIVGFLRSGGEVQLDLELDPGVEYLIAGVCDQDCGDLDLALTDGDNAVLFTDELDDDAPVLQFMSQPDEVYTIWVTMYACSIEPCSFAYQVFRR
ncbi:MAG TPA: hypothetical protein VJ982_04935 [Gemmatimonadota bacterium]|nr:hypothetical protein [Gemmatimonadota bacterium]